MSKNLIKALAEAQSAVMPVGKDGDVVGKFRYASHNHVIRVAKKALLDAGLVWTPLQVTCSKDVVELHWSLTHVESGEHIASSYQCADWQMRNMGAAQALGATTSYLKKYALIGLLMLDVGDDAVEHYDRVKAEEEDAERKRAEAEARKEWQMLRKTLDGALSEHLVACGTDATPAAKLEALRELMGHWPNRPTADDYRAAIHSVSVAEQERRDAEA